MARNEVSILITAKNMLAKGLHDIRSFVSSAAGLVSRVGAGLAKGMAGAAAAVTTLVAAGRQLVGMYREAAQIEARRNAILQATGFAAGKTATELNKMASALEKQTGIDDDIIKSTQGMIASFDMIRGDTFDRATVAALDMSAGLQKAGADAAAVEEAGQMLGKALQDPIAGMSRLAKSGVMLTDSQKALVKSLQESGNLQGAQAVILEAVETRFKGAAAATHAMAGGLDDLRNMLSNAGEDMGKVIVDSEGFKGAVTAAKDAIQELTESGKLDLWVANTLDAFSALKEGVTPIVTWLGKWLGTIWEYIQRASAAAGSFAQGIASGKSVGESATQAGNAFDTYIERKKAMDEIKLKEIQAKKAAEESLQIEKERAAMAKVRSNETTNEAYAARKVLADKAKELEIQKKISSEKAKQEQQVKAAQEMQDLQNKQAAAQQVANEAGQKLEESQKTTITDYIKNRRDQLKAERETAKQTKDTEKDIARLEAKAGRKGLKLSKAEEETLNAARQKKRDEDFLFKQRKDAQEVQRKAAEEIKAKEDKARETQLKQLESQLRTEKKLQDNLTAPE